jgi:cysteine desulfurase
MERRYYFDWAATAIPGGFEGPEIPFGNPSSKHAEGRLAREALEAARCRCAAVLDVPADRIYFTAGGTEANALVLHSLLLRKGRPGLLFSAVEHPSIRENAAVLERLGRAASPIAVETDGRVSGETLERALAKAPESRMAAIMAVNNETGAVMDMGDLAG